MIDEENQQSLPTMSPKIVVSASRTKDLVRCRPNELADVISGRRTCRFGLGRQLHTLKPSQIHTLVLWTKSPQNLLENKNLHQSLKQLLIEGSQIALHISVTGFGASFVEPGIEKWSDTLATVKELIESGMVLPDLVTLRYDPLLRLDFDDWTISNCSIELFEAIIVQAAKLKIKRVITSACDLDTYKRAAKRIGSVGLKAVGPNEKEAIELVKAMAAVCHNSELLFSVCCSPKIDFDDFGCVDGKLYNKTSEGARSSEVLHNKVGSQRPRCLCTHSRDIGYSKGFTHCFSQGAGCVYCYSQGGTMGAMEKAVLSELERLRNSDRWWENAPYDYLVER